MKTQVTLNGTQYTVVSVMPDLTVPDCFVLPENKVGKAHGERKFYVGEKGSAKQFFGPCRTIKCIALKKDFQIYLNTIKDEYLHPTMKYGGKRNLGSKWEERKAKIDLLDETLEFEAVFQDQISGPRGYLNSKSEIYNLYRELSLPYVSYVSLMKLKASDGHVVFYWRLFVDFNALRVKGVAPLALIYGRRDKVTIDTTGLSKKEKRSASKQAKFRDGLFKEYNGKGCPVTGITTPKLLVASHIKPARFSTDAEEVDPKNGFLLSPLYDRLFDQGLVTFDSDKSVRVSPWLTIEDQRRCKVKTGMVLMELPLDSEREKYLVYHRENVFKGVAD